MRRLPGCSQTSTVIQSAVLGLLVGSSLASAQTPPPPTTLHSSSTLVVVPTLVQTPARKPVYALTSEDFALTDDGLAQQVTLESDEAARARPLALVVLLQIGGAAHQQYDIYAHLDTMLAAVVHGTPNKVAVVEFDSEPEWDSPFISDPDHWADEIDKPHWGNGGAAIFDALAYALHLLNQQPPDTRRAILLISQQHDVGSKTKVQDIVRDVGESNTAVYSLTFSVEKSALKQAFTFRNPPPPNPPLNVGDHNGDQGYVQYFQLSPLLDLAIGAMHKNLAAEVAGLSGGEPFGFGNKVEFDRALNTLSNDVRNGYTLSFQPAAPVPGLHTLKVAVPDHPDYLVSARANYWAGGAKTPE
jgi:VWFA-related protein